MTRGLRIGIDLGGTKIEAAAIDNCGQTAGRHRVATPVGDYSGTVAAVAELVAALEHALDATATVGVGIPGTISPATGVVKNANSTWLNGRPLDRDLATALGRPVRVANDANCFALSEATDGAGAGMGNVFGAILGTGVGGGVALGGHILVGANAIAGEWGHNPLPAPRPDEIPGEPCYCGRSGCIETFLSGPAFAAQYRRIGTQSLTATEIADAAASGDRGAAAALAAYIDRLARALASVINLIDPDVIVLGGGLSRIAALYHEVPRRWQRYIFSDQVTTRLLPPVHGDASGVRGAAWLWPREEA
jgi:fructokinase